MGYLRFATDELDPTSVLNVLAHAERAERGPGFAFDPDVVTPETFAAVLGRIDGFVDCTDFDVLYLLNLWYGHRGRLRADLVEAIERRLLAFKYWYTEPTPDGAVDDRWYWSENHRIIFHVDEYLAGQAFPDEVFSNDRRTGAEHRDEARARILTWIDEKARFGFTEWHSDVYYQKDVTPLLSLVEWADDAELARRAAMVLDLVLFDVALHLHRGTFGATHGRSYMKDKSKAADEDTFGFAKLLFDDTRLPYPSRSDPGAVLFARARTYRLPEVVRRVARFDAAMVDRERVGVPLDPLAPIEPSPGAPYGYDFDDPANIPFWWERGAHVTWQLVATTLATLDRHGLWDSQFFTSFKPLADAVGGDRDTLRTFVRDLAPMLNFGLLPEANTYTWRSEHVMLSTVQDHRPGHFGEQQHVWQATLDEEALVFTTHPKNEPPRARSWPDADGYWTGSGSLPRSAQHGRAAVHLYSPGFEPGEGPLARFGYRPYTHAWFPTERFDEVVRAGRWTFGRKGGGWLGLWSWREPRWREHDPDAVFTDGLTAPFDLVAEGGPDNVWIVEVGDVTTGTFDAFRAALEAATVEVAPRPGGGFDVEYASPAEGVVRFGNDGPLTVDGTEIAISDYPRYDNPWAQVAFGSRRYEIADEHGGVVLDFAAGIREVTPY